MTKIPVSSLAPVSERGNILLPLQMGKVRLRGTYASAEAAGGWEFVVTRFLAYLATQAKLFPLHLLKISTISQKIYIFLLP